MTSHISSTGELAAPGSLDACTPTSTFSVKSLWNLTENNPNELDLMVIVPSEPVRSSFPYLSFIDVPGFGTAVPSYQLSSVIAIMHPPGINQGEELEKLRKCSFLEHTLGDAQTGILLDVIKECGFLTRSVGPEDTFVKLRGVRDVAIRKGFAPLLELKDNMLEMVDYMEEGEVSEIEFLRQISYGSFTAGSDSLPLEKLARLRLMLGPHALTDTRANPNSQLRLMAEVLRGAMQTVGANVSDARLALKVSSSVDSFMLPRCFMSNTLEPPAMIMEVEDAVAYNSCKSSAVAVANRRCSLAGRVFPFIGKLLEVGEGDSDHSDLMSRLMTTFLSAAQHKQLPHRQLAELEVELAKRGASIDTLLGSIDDLHDIVETLVLQENEHGLSARAGSGMGVGGDETSLTSYSDLRPEATSRATNSVEFQSLVDECAPLDLNSDDDKMMLFEYIFTSKVVIAMRYAVTLNPKLRNQSPFFGKVERCAEARGPYFSRALAMDEYGQVPINLQEFEFDKGALAQLLEGSFGKVNFIGAFCQLKHLETSVKTLEPTESELYTVVSVLEGIQTIGEKAFTALGFPTVISPEEGSTFREVCNIQIGYIKWAQGFPAAESKSLLEYGASEFKSMLARAGREWIRTMMAAEPKDEKLGAFLPINSKYETNLKAKRDAAAPIVSARRAFPTLLPTEPKALPGTMAATKEVAMVSGGSNNDGGGDKLLTGKPGKPGLGKQKHQELEDKPGNKASFSHLIDSTHLLLGSRVYDLNAIANKYSISIDSVCWPTLLSTKEGEAARALCPKHTDKAHGKMGVGKHAHPTGWDVDWITKNASTKAKSADRKKVSDAKKQRKA